MYYINKDVPLNGTSIETAFKDCLSLNTTFLATKDGAGDWNIKSFDNLEELKKDINLFVNYIEKNKNAKIYIK